MWKKIHYVVPNAARFELRSFDRIAIVTRKELSKNTINASMSVLSRHYPDIGG